MSAHPVPPSLPLQSPLPIPSLPAQPSRARALPARSHSVEPELGGVRCGAFFRALFDGLATRDQEWVLELISRYAKLNAESGDPARF